MSSTRLSISNELIDTLRQLHQAAIAYEKEHTSDGLYHGTLLTPLREQYDDTSLDFVEDFITSLAFLGRAQKKLAESGNLNIQAVYANAILAPIAKLIFNIGLLKNTFTPNISEQNACASAITQLENLSLQAKKLLLIDYKNHLEALVGILEKFEAAPLIYKQKHQEDHLYEEALVKPCKFLAETKLDFVQDFLENYKEIKLHAKDLEEKAIDTASQLTAVKKLDKPVMHLLEELSLFKKAPEINEIDQKTCTDAITDLTHLKLITESISLMKPNQG